MEVQAGGVIECSTIMSESENQRYVTASPLFLSHFDTTTDADQSK